jgi:hypothetical protein
MKVRSDFVSNSSSTSFILAFKKNTHSRAHSHIDPRWLFNLLKNDDLLDDLEEEYNDKVQQQEMDKSLHPPDEDWWYNQSTKKWVKWSNCFEWRQAEIDQLERLFKVLKQAEKCDRDIIPVTLDYNYEYYDEYAKLVSALRAEWKLDILYEIPG